MGLEGGGEGCELPEKLRTCCSQLLLCVKNCTAVRVIFYLTDRSLHASLYGIKILSDSLLSGFDFCTYRLMSIKNYLYVYISILEARATCQSESSKVCIFWNFTMSRVKWIIIMGTFISCAWHYLASKENYSNISNRRIIGELIFFAKLLKLSAFMCSHKICTVINLKNCQIHLFTKLIKKTCSLRAKFRWNLSKHMVVIEVTHALTNELLSRHPWKRISLAYPFKATLPPRHCWIDLS